MPIVVDPAEVFRGTIVLAVPHMDDCVLGCGGTLAQLSCGRTVHVIYATDGQASPAPVWPWLDRRVPDLAPTRADEARAAMGHLGVPQENIHFLGLPDGQLRRQRAASTTPWSHGSGRFSRTISGCLSATIAMPIMWR